MTLKNKFGSYSPRIRKLKLNIKGFRNMLNEKKEESPNFKVLKNLRTGQGLLVVPTLIAVHILILMSTFN